LNIFFLYFFTEAQDKRKRGKWWSFKNLISGSPAKVDDDVENHEMDPLNPPTSQQQQQHFVEIEIEPRGQPTCPAAMDTKEKLTY
jgi:hypothetical protein